jgi:ABC-type transport system involved in cytochrome c biogenesis permease subunit
MQIWLFRGAFILYSLAAGLGLAYLYSRNEKLAQWKFRLLSLGLLAHAISFALLLSAFWQHPENRFLFPINSFYGALSWLALANAAVFFIIESRARLQILGAFVLPWSALAAGAAVFSAPNLAPLAPQLQSFRMNLHPAVLMLSYAAFANAFGVALALLIQERQLQSKRPSELCYRLPPIAELDNLHYRIITLVFPVFVGGLAMGGAWAHAAAWGDFWKDPKVLAALVACANYGYFLYLRGYKGLRGLKPVYVSLAGFVWILFGFFAINYLSTRHGFLYGR